MTHAKNFTKPNGHAGPPGRPNGHAPASSERSGVSHQSGLAGSDDASRLPVASASAHKAAAGTACEAYADVATLPPHGAASPCSSHKNRGSDNNQASEEQKPHEAGERESDERECDDQVAIPAGKTPLAADGAAFVEVVHQHVDLYLAAARLVKSGDEKISQRMVERLLEMKFGKGPSVSAEESSEYVFDVDSAVARRAAQGAKK